MRKSVPLLQVIAIGAPMLLAVWFTVRDRRRAAAATRARQRIEARGLELRAPGDLSPGKATFAVRAVGAPGTRINLGFSVERPSDGSTLSAAPTLLTFPFRVQTESGVMLSVPAGLPLRIRRFAGAYRNLQEAVTTEQGGIEQRFSFEVPVERPFQLQCTIPERTAGAYRDGDVVLSAPEGGPLVVNPAVDVPDMSGVAVIAYPVFAGSAWLGWYLADWSGLWAAVGWIGWGLLMAISAKSVRIAAGAGLPAAKSDRP